MLPHQRSVLIAPSYNEICCKVQLGILDKKNSDYVGVVSKTAYLTIWLTRFFWRPHQRFSDDCSLWRFLHAHYCPPPIVPEPLPLKTALLYLCSSQYAITMPLVSESQHDVSCLSDTVCLPGRQRWRQRASIGLLWYLKRGLSGILSYRVWNRSACQVSARQPGPNEQRHPEFCAGLPGRHHNGVYRQYMHSCMPFDFCC